MHRRIALFALLSVLSVIALPEAVPGAVAPFDAKAFAEAQNAGKSVVVMVHAPW